MSLLFAGKWVHHWPPPVAKQGVAGHPPSLSLAATWHALSHHRETGWGCVRLKSVPKSKENVVNFYLILRLGSSPSLVLLPHGSRMDLLAVTTLWVSHNIGNIVGRIILRIRVGIILSWYYSTSITTPYYHSILGPYSHSMILRAS